jgi:hypothetical protein
MENDFIYQVPVPYIFNKNHNEIISNIYYTFSLFGIYPNYVKYYIYYMITTNYPFYYFKQYIESNGLFYMDPREMYSFLI